MAQLNGIITVVVFFIFYTIASLEGFSFNRVKRQDPFTTIRNRINYVQGLNFTTPVLGQATERRKIACFFVFDKDATTDLQNSLDLATEYATQLALLASKYMASVNTVVTNAGTEIWKDYDRISFAVGGDVYSAMPDFVTQFQDYLSQTQKALFGTVYAVGVLISKKPLVQGGYSQGPPCSTSGVSLINYKPYPWSIGGLLAHELAHTLSVVHPFELAYLCESNTTTLEFCQRPNAIPPECKCDDSTHFPPEQCLMTFQFGAALTIAPKFTKCDIQMMNYFSSNIPCLIQSNFSNKHN